MTMLQQAAADEFEMIRGTRAVLGLLAGKWNVLVLYLLASGTRRHRILALLASILAALALATPAPASDPDDDDEEDDSPPIVLPSLESSPRVSKGGGGVEGEKKSGSGGEKKSSPKRTLHRQATRIVHARRAFAVQTVPRGGVQAGAGGMAPDGPDGGLLGFAAGSLVLLASGGLIARGRRDGA